MQRQGDKITTVTEAASDEFANGMNSHAIALEQTEDETHVANCRILREIYSSNHNINSQLLATNPIVRSLQVTASNVQPVDMCNNSGLNRSQASTKLQDRSDTIEGTSPQQPLLPSNFIPAPIFAYSPLDMYLIGVGASILANSPGHSLLTNLSLNFPSNHGQQTNTTVHTGVTSKDFQGLSEKTCGNSNTAVDNENRFSSNDGGNSERTDCAVTCTVCNEAFDNTHNLCRHMKQYHQTTSNVPNNIKIARRHKKNKAQNENETLNCYLERYCHICDKDLSNKFSAALHMWQQHKLIVEAYMMRKVSKEELSRQEVQYMCMQCRDVRLETQSILQQHRKDFHKYSKRFAVSPNVSQYQNESRPNWYHAAYHRLQVIARKQKVAITDRRYNVNVAGSDKVSDRKSFDICSPLSCDVETVKPLHKKLKNLFDPDAIGLIRKANSDIKATDFVSQPLTSYTRDNSSHTSAECSKVQRRGRKSANPKKVEVGETHQVTHSE